MVNLIGTTRDSGFCDDPDCLCHWLEGYVHCPKCHQLIDVDRDPSHRCAPFELPKPIQYEDDGDVLWA